MGLRLRLVMSGGVVGLAAGLVAGYVIADRNQLRFNHLWRDPYDQVAFYFENELNRHSGTITGDQPCYVADQLRRKYGVAAALEQEKQTLLWWSIAFNPDGTEYRERYRTLATRVEHLQLGLRNRAEDCIGTQ